MEEEVLQRLTEVFAAKAPQSVAEAAQREAQIFEKGDDYTTAGQGPQPKKRRGRRRPDTLGLHLIEMRKRQARQFFATESYRVKINLGRHSNRNFKNFFIRMYLRV